MEESNLEDKKNNSDSIIENSHLNQRNLASSFKDFISIKKHE